MSGSLRGRAKVVLGRAGRVTLIHGRYSVKKTRPKYWPFFLLLDRMLCYYEKSSKSHLLTDRLIKQKRISFSVLASLYTVDVNFDSHSWAVVKLSVTINCLYKRSAYLCGEWTTERCRGCKLLPRPADCVKEIQYQHSNCCSVLQCLQCTVCTPPVSPKILSRSDGARMSLPTTDFLKPGAYCSTQSNAAETDRRMLYH